MQTFRGKVSNLISAIFMLCLMGGGSLWLAWDVDSRVSSRHGGVSAFFGLLGLGIIALFSYIILECLTAYRVDADGITRRGWNGEQQMRWSDVTHFAAGGGADSALMLTDYQNNKLSIQRGMMGGAKLAELNQLLDTHLAPIRERQLSEMGGINNVYHPKRSAAWAGVIMTTLVGAMLAFIAAQPVPSNQQGAFIAVIIIFGGIELLFVYLTILGFTHSLMFTADGITDSSVFRARHIPFRSVSSVMSRRVSTKNGSYDLTTVEGEGQKIMLTSHANDYELLIDYIRSHVDAGAKQQGEAKSEEIQRKNDKQAKILLPILAVVYMLFLGGIGVWSLREGNERMEHYRLMDTQGKTAAGRITGKDTQNGGKHTTYLLQYAFDDANGQHIQAASPVSWEDYAGTRVGASARVIYVPGRKNVSRLEQSIGRKQAEGKVRSGYMLLVLGTVFPILLAITPFTRKRKQAAGG